MFALQFFSPEHSGLWVTISNLVLLGLFMLLSMGKLTRRERSQNKKAWVFWDSSSPCCAQYFQEGRVRPCCFHSCCSFDQHSMWRHALNISRHIHSGMCPSPCLRQAASAWIILQLDPKQRCGEKQMMETIHRTGGLLMLGAVWRVALKDFPTGLRKNKKRF